MSVRKSLYIVCFLLCGMFLFIVGKSEGKKESNKITQQTVPIPSKSITPSEKVAEASISAVTQQGLGEIATVKRVIDGDTIELLDGRHVRYIGIDTPETVHPEKPVQCFGKEASAENTRLVSGKQIRMVRDISNTDRYGRLLRYVYVDTIFVNQALVQNGFAYSYSYPPDIALQELFRQAQADAQNQGKGLWSGCQAIVATPIPKQVSQTNECVIKGNISAGGEKIYHLPECGSYAKTTINTDGGEKYFCLEQEAIAAGWRKAKNCP